MNAQTRYLDEVFDEVTVTTDVVYGQNITVNQNVNLLGQGVDPKPLVLEFCKPQCTYWK